MLTQPFFDLGPLGSLYKSAFCHRALHLKVFLYQTSATPDPSSPPSHPEGEVVLRASEKAALEPPKKAKASKTGGYGHKGTPSKIRHRFQDMPRPGEAAVYGEYTGSFFTPER